MKRLAGVMGILLVLVAVSGSATPQAKAAPINAVILNKYLCTALTFAFYNTTPIGCQTPAQMDGNLITFTDAVGQKTSNLIQPPPILIPDAVIPGTLPLPVDPSTLKYEGDHIPKKEDFAGIDRDLDQLHEIGGDMIVIVFVDRQWPVQIHVDNGFIYDQAGVNRIHDWTCGFNVGHVGDDPDCIDGAANGNGAVVFGLKPDTERGKRGPGTITIIQDRTPLDLKFTVVGEANHIAYTNLKTNLEVGTDGGVANPDAASPLSTRNKATLTKADDCGLPGTASGFLDANGTAQKTVSLIRVFDNDGTSITGAFIRWQSDNPDVGTVAAGLTPTIDLGTFGIGAPNIACGTSLPGTFHLDARTRSTQGGGRFPNPCLDAPLFACGGLGAVIDPAATEDINLKATFTVVGAPTTIALTAAPDTMPCDGVATSTISASVVDENGAPVADGQEVRFDVVAFGAANPIVAKVKGGVATTVVSPLASSQTSMTVNVTASANEGKFFDLQTAKNSIRIDCNGGGAAAIRGNAGAPAGGGAGANAAPATGSIKAPDTGFGPAGAVAGVGVWPLLALAMLGAALSALRFAVRKNG